MTMVRESLESEATRVGTLTRVVAVFGAAHLYCAYLFVNRLANRMKVLAQDGLDIWLAVHRPHQGKFL
jgi:hypothetical protein